MNRRAFLPVAALAALLAATAWSAPVASNGKYSPERVAEESAKANAFFDRVFEETLARSPQLEAQLGIKRDTDKWDDISEAHAREELELTVKHYAELPRLVDFDALDAQTRISYRMFVRESELAIEGWRWRHHDYPFNQMSGLCSEAPAFLINAHRVDTVADARAYVARLRGLAPLLDELIAGARRRQAEGILPPKFVFPLVADSVREIIAGQPFDNSARKSALLEDFEGKVAALKDLDAVTRSQLGADARAALVEAVKPAYERVLAVLAEQERVATDDDGVWKLPDGLAYYAFALRQANTTTLTADEIHALGLREVARIHREIEAIMAKVGFKGDLAAFLRHMKEDPQFYYPNTPAGRAAYLKRATEIVDAVRARLGEFFVTLPKAPLIIKPVEAFREQGSAAAFLDPSTPDGSRPGVYYVNTLDMRGLPIFEMETLAHHEAIPGHHLQIAIAQELTGLPKFRMFDENSAYVEGWALYAEYFPKEFGFYSDPYQDYGRLNDELLRAVRLVVDTGIHAKRWTRAQVMDYFRQNTSNSERDIFTETNRYIVWPGQATSYKIGMIQILALREEAKRELGPAFDLRKFHDVILRNGAVPMDLLAEIVRDWIAAQRH